MSVKTVTKFIGEFSHAVSPNDEYLKILKRSVMKNFRNLLITF